MTVRHNREQHAISDRLVAAADQALRVVAGTPRAQRSSPAAASDNDALQPAERRHAARLMRVNHAGEVAAQALYQGQALTAKLEQVRDTMEHAAAEETDHLAWCEQRIDELGGQRSLLNPLWYAGSFTIGALAGIAGDRWSLGFVAETERQVVNHLDDHLERLPAADNRSRAVLEQMRTDEAAHGSQATAAGGRELPPPIARLMSAVSRVMTRTAYWI
ncbi:MAG: 2-polyprenyl-3-methyl-6-methoxy-1,4-benzoquinone monooxygenase [Gammaproteobacteria bacterium]|nr:2-polyprenyl-3-methyl-6-methoxy-1,4-benzoquinone monooxygenase [Gammaproteobacteria bacterium]NNF60086.1 2-polyprenyl-3-methyl-6-methoxy-1,4-benzoquinone monooxygenase [Gammaproteobacteria bacterium]NNM19858.1 2-polyprenyl-3-methyl-6-methoxy-1,4-benzoquinone monooxygenase [Gammaproteobacteria bacterium]